MKLRDIEMLMLYNPDSTIGKQALAFAQTFSNKINSYAFNTYKISTTRWQDLLEMMNMKPKELLDKSLPLYQEKVKGHEYDDEGWLLILTNHPELIKGVIAVKGNKAIYCQTPSEIFKLSQV